MKKYNPVVLLTIIIMSIVFIHACTKTIEEDCVTCRAIDSDERVVASEKSCTADHEEGFRERYSGYFITCY